MNNEKQIYDTLIIGSGPAGLTASIYNARSSLKTVVISGNQPGGQLTITTLVDNYPGFPNGVGGVKLMIDMQQQAKNLGVEIKQGMVKLISLSDSQPVRLFKVELENGEILEARSVIVTTGAAVKWLDLPKEKELIGHGISGCATCDGMFFRGKTVAVVGGGDTACEEAAFLSKICEKVYLIHRRDELRASIAEQKKVLNNPKVEIWWNSEVVELNPNNQNPSIPNKLENIKIKNNKTGEEKILNLDGLFVAIGSSPATKFLEGIVDLSETGQVFVGKNKEHITMTSMEGIFAAGDCVNIKHKQAIVAAGEGCRAALDTESWLSSL
ncbi:MAG: thioredoxin-disulfide reductase [Candidatus Shapirobacteria bacterium]|nr:thioredoxin-disulfide reductase [Candidatus Shapirobacteria bacterium]